MLLPLTPIATLPPFYAAIHPLWPSSYFSRGGRRACTQSSGRPGCSHRWAQLQPEPVGGEAGLFGGLSTDHVLNRIYRYAHISTSKPNHGSFSCRLPMTHLGPNPFPVPTYALTSPYLPSPLPGPLSPAGYLMQVAPQGNTACEAGRSTRRRAATGMDLRMIGYLMTRTTWIGVRSHRRRRFRVAASRAYI